MAVSITFTAEDVFGLMAQMRHFIGQTMDGQQGASLEDVDIDPGPKVKKPRKAPVAAPVAATGATSDPDYNPDDVWISMK